MFILLAQTADGTTTSNATEKFDETLPWLKTIRVFLAENATDFALRLLAALAIFVIGRMVIRILIGFVNRALERANADKILVGFAENVLSVGLLIVVIMASLQTLGVELTSLTAILAAAGFAIGLALQGSLSNFAAGILLVILKPFEVGDYVQAGGVSGTIEEIHIFNCTMRTFDNIRMTVPNGEITSNVISNYTSEPNRLITLNVGCGYDDDLRAVKSLLTGLVERHEKILTEPAPLVAVDELGSSSVNFVVRPWVKNEDFWSVKRELIEQIKLSFDAQGFSFPFSSHDVYVHDQTEMPVGDKQTS